MYGQFIRVLAPKWDFETIKLYPSPICIVIYLHVHLYFFSPFLYQIHVYERHCLSTSPSKQRLTCIINFEKRATQSDRPKTLFIGFC